MNHILKYKPCKKKKMSRCLNYEKKDLNRQNNIIFVKCFANIPRHPVYKKGVTNKRKEMYRWVPTYQHNRIKNKKHY